jgi:hypothetical protein
MVIEMLRAGSARLQERPVTPSVTWLGSFDVWTPALACVYRTGYDISTKHARQSDSALL